MSRHYGICSKYDHKRNHYVVPRTQREAGIDHLEWDKPVKMPGWLLPTVIIVFFSIGGLIAEAFK